MDLRMVGSEPSKNGPYFIRASRWDLFPRNHREPHYSVVDSFRGDDTVLPGQIGAREIERISRGSRPAFQRAAFVI